MKGQKSVFHIFKIEIMVVLALFMVGCASIPSEAPELSKQLGYRISAIEEAHFRLLDNFFQQKRNQIDDFIDKEWVPEFANQFFSNPVMKKAWITIVIEDNDEQRLQFLLRTAPVLYQQIEKKRRELLDPLNKLEYEIKQTLKSEYSQTKAINNSLTSFLQSAADVEKNRQRYSENLGIDQYKLNDWINKTDTAVLNLLSQSEKAEDTLERGKQYIEKLNDIQNDLKLKINSLNN